MPLKNRLKEYRAKINVNQQEMGQLVQVSRQTISQIERGDYSPSVTFALKIAKVLEVEKVEGSNKLYKIQIDLGTEKRQIVSGLVPYYTEEACG